MGPGIVGEMKTLILFREISSSLIFMSIAFTLLLAWPLNAFRFARCDFEPSYKGEVVHGIGIIIPPVALISAWSNWDR
jgi:hypothetical protein